ncbi:hypothetical protein D3C81_482410 [compost metagenome]
MVYGCQAGLDLVLVVVAKVRQASHPAIGLVLQPQFLVDAGLGLEVLVALQVATGGLSIAALATAVEQVVRVQLVKVRCLVGPGDTRLEGQGLAQGMGQVERGAPVVADDAVVVEAQAWGEHGTGRQLDIVLGEQREDLRRRRRVAPAAGQAVDRAAFAGALGVGAGVVEFLLHPLAAQGQGLVKADAQGQIDLAVGGEVAQHRGVEAGIAENALGAASQALVDAAVTGFFVLQVGHGAAEVPFAAMGQRVVFTVGAVGFVAEHALYIGVAVGVLGIAGIEVALAAEPGLDIHRLLRGQTPAEQTVEVLVAHAFAASGQGSSLITGALRFVALVDVPIIGVGLGHIAIDPVTEVLGQWAIEAEAHALGRAFVLVRREGGVHRGVAVGFGPGLLGDDVDHPAGRAVTVAGSSGATDDLDSLDLVGRHPVGVATAVTLAAPAVAHRVAAADRLAVDQNQGVLRAHATNVDLAVVATLAAGGVAGQVDSRHGADDLRQVVGGRALLDVFSRDHRHAWGLFGFFFGGGDDGLGLQYQRWRLAVLWAFGGGVYGAGQQVAAGQQEGNQRAQRTGRHR